MATTETAFKNAVDKAIRLFLRDKSYRTYSGAPAVVLDFELFVDSDGWRCLNCETPGFQPDFIRIPNNYEELLYDRSHCNECGWMMNLPQEIVVRFYDLCLRFYAEELGYPSDFFKRTNGSLWDEPLEREPQGEL